MSEAVIVALISGAISLISVVFSYRSTSNKMQHSMEVQQAIFSTELQNVKKVVDEHNGYAKLFAENMPLVHEQIKVINHRLKDLEAGQLRLEEKK